MTTQTTQTESPLLAAMRDAAVDEDVGADRVRAQPLTARLPAFNAVIEEAHREYRHQAANADAHISYGAEWFLDNYYIVQRALREVREDMPRGFYRELPTLTAPTDRAGYPRIYAVAANILVETGAGVPLASLADLVDAYQEVSPLTIGELWALPTMLRFGLISCLSQALARDLRLTRPASAPQRDLVHLADDLAAQEVIAHAVQSLHALNRQDWADFFEQVNLAERTLRADPVYAVMDFATRDRYREAVQELAVHSKHTELTVARKALDLMHIAAENTSSPRRRHVGYFLIDQGRPALEAELGYRAPLLRRLARSVRRHPTTLYLGTMFILTLLFLIGVGVYAGAAGARAWLPAVLVLALIPTLSAANSLVTTLLTRRYPPRVLPKLDFAQQVPASSRTMIAIPALLTGEAEVDQLLARMEQHYLGNTDPYIGVALLSDFVDADRETIPGDKALLTQAVDGVDALNRRHGTAAHQPFYLFHRRRLWNAGEGVWMGWERKRGKLEEFNRLLRGHQDTSFTKVVGATESLVTVRYVITLDADTELPPGSAHRLIGTLAHPLNRAEFDPATGALTAGYTILQPRTEVNPVAAMRTPFSRIFSGDTGIDLYTLAVSDVYQDLFGEGIYVGKGIYDVDAFSRTLAGRVPENHLLSHDLFEGIHGRAALVSDIVIYEDYPASYLAQAQRRHRWIRGDWQLLPWLAPMVPATDGGRTQTVLSNIDRWKILDNLRRSLLMPAVLSLLVAGWLWLPRAPLVWTILALTPLLTPLVIESAAWLVDGVRLGASLASVQNMRTLALRALLTIAFLPHAAFLALDAIARTLHRVYVTRRHLLEWTTSAQTARRIQRRSRRFAPWLQAFEITAFALVMGGALIWWAPHALPVALPFLVAWLVAPLVVTYISRASSRPRAALTDAEVQQLRNLAKRTWLYFEHFVGPEDNWLPPDHFQEEPLGVAAHRTSPTNIGLMLLATIAAYDFGYVSLPGAALRLQNTFATLDELERHQGHFLNWYATQSLRPLAPRYISMVDSGNLAACLIALQRSLIDMTTRPVLRWSRWQGLRDTLGNLGEALDTLAAPKPSTHDDLRATLRELENEIVALGNEPHQWIPTLVRLNEDKLPALITQLQSLLDRTEQHTPPEALHTLRIFVNRTHHQLADMQRELDRLGPWHRLFSQMPQVVRTRINTEAPLAVHWESLQAQLCLTLSIADTPAACRAAEPMVHALQSGLLDGAEPSDRAAIQEWSGELLTGLSSAHDATQELLAMLDRVYQRADGFVNEMDFGTLYDEQRDVFHIGFNVDRGSLDDNYYDLLASEARLGSFVAIAKHDVPLKHWVHLGRPLTVTTAGQTLLSWSGTMFEYLMPGLLLRMPPQTLLTEACRVAVAEQIRYARRRGHPWGISESGYYRFDANEFYQYQAFGVPGLGFKRGLGDDVIIAPYASLLALNLVPRAVVQNMANLNARGLLGDYGYYEAVDFTADRLPPGAQQAIVHSFMAHHQGMILLALLNYLQDDVMVTRFHSDPRVENIRMLLHEQIPRHVPPEELGNDVEAPLPVAEPRIRAESWEVAAATPTPQVHFLSNGRYGVLVTNSGGGFSRWRDTDLTRWRADSTLDDWGTWIYVRDEDTHELWSPTRQPVANSAESHSVHFAPDYACFLSRHGTIAMRLDIFVAPDDAVEIRRVRLTNQGDTPRRLTVCSYAEVVLGDQRADRRHPAFNKMFIESEHVAHAHALVFRRRPRTAGETPPFLAHGLASPPLLNGFDMFETSRRSFISRASSVHAPEALVSDLTTRRAKTGATLDPIMAMGRQIELDAHATVELAFITTAGSSRQEVLYRLHQYQDWQAIARVEGHAHTAAELEMRRLNITTGELAAMQKVLSALLYPNEELRAPADVIAANKLGQSGLWPYAISGDYPILLLRVEDENGLALVQDALRAHRYWRNRNMPVCLVILNEKASSYAQTLHGQVEQLVQRKEHRDWLNRRAGIFLLRNDQLPDTAKTLLQSAARVILDQSNGTLAAHVYAPTRPPAALPAFQPGGSTAGLPSLAPLSRPDDLQFDNGLGGFSADGREYVIFLEPGQSTPAPWSNVVANPAFGFLMTERGSSFTWAANSGENRLTPWSNDPVVDPTGEALYLRDEETGVIWSPTPAPADDGTPYLVRHGAGYTIFAHHSQGLKQELRAFVPKDDAVKIVTLRLENGTDHPRRITATYYAEWVLGVNRDEMQQTIVPGYDEATGALLATNRYNTEFGARVAFLGADHPPHSVTTDRTEFLGRAGRKAQPAGLMRIGLSGTVRAGVDPCAAYQVHIDLPPGASHEVHFLLGQGEDHAAALQLLEHYCDAGHVHEAWDEVTTFWNDTLATVQVETPDPAFDLLINRWLLYQNLSCRVWGRSAFYQSSGAYGFRDQLQDVMALLNAQPELARAHILRAARHQFEEGDVLHWWHPPSGRGVRTRITDDLLWLPYVTARYVQWTGDLSVLEEDVPFVMGEPLAHDEEERYDHFATTSTTASLYEHCLRAITRGTTSGAHGLPLFGTGDWNDGMNRVGAQGSGESVWLAWFLAATLDAFAPLCVQRDDEVRAARYQEQAAALRAAVDDTAWDGEWYLRGYYDDGTPLGASAGKECRIDAIAQSWAVFARGVDSTRVRTAMHAVADNLVDRRLALIRLFTPAFDQTPHDPGYIKGYPPGVRENGGQYTHAAIWTIWAFAALGEGDRAVDLLGLINPIRHTETMEQVQRYRVEPFVVAADIYTATEHPGQGGWTWYTGSAGWMYRLGTEGILGLRREGDCLQVDPCLASTWPEVNITLRHGQTRYSIRVENPEGVCRGVTRVELDGVRMKEHTVPLTDDGMSHEVRVRLGHSVHED